MKGKNYKLPISRIKGVTLEILSTLKDKDKDIVNFNEMFTFLENTTF